MIEKIKQLGVITFCLGISFLVSGVILQNIFIGNTPTVRPHLDSYLAMKLRNAMNPVSTLVAKLQNKNTTGSGTKTVEERSVALQNIPFSAISKGVAARERDGVSEVKYELNSIKWIEYSYTTKEGKVLKIQVPEGQQPPPPGAL
jgi:hypothetical protein